LIEWTSATSTQIKIEAIDETGSIVNIGTTTNSGSYTWSIPKDQSKGNYQFRFTDTGSNKVVESEYFSIAPKFSVVIKAIPIFIAGVVIFILLQPDEIPDPVEPD